MATRSNITLKRHNGEYATIYCHYDGYIENNGVILLNHYNTYNDVESLIKLGDISILSKSIEKVTNHSFSNPVDGYTVFYNRDRGENWEETKPIITKNFKLPFVYSDINFHYVFINEKWYVRNIDEFKNYYRLKSDIDHANGVIISYEEVL